MDFYYENILFLGHNFIIENIHFNILDKNSLLVQFNPVPVT